MLGRFALALVAVTLVAVTLVAMPARAQEDAGVSAATLVRRAEAEEAAAHPREALAAWQQVVTLAPTSRFASRARARIAWVEERAEGDYAPLARMMAFVDRPVGERDDDAVRALESELAAMPAGRVRAECRLAVASDWARLGETDRAVEAWRASLDEPFLHPGERELVRESMADARMDAGDLRGAIDEIEQGALEGSSIHHAAERRLRAERWVPVAYGALGLFVLVVLALTVRSGRAREAMRALGEAPLRPVLAGLVGFGPAAIVAWWGDESLPAFEAFAPCAFVIVLLSFVAADVLASRPARALVASLAIVASLASAYASVALFGEALPFA